MTDAKTLAPDADETKRRAPRYYRFLFRTPGPAATVGLLLLTTLVTAGFLFWGIVDPARLVVSWLAILVLPALAAALLTGPIAKTMGGRFSLRRSSLLSAMATVALIPVAIVGRAVSLVSPVGLGSDPAFLLLLTGPTIWFRHMSLFGVSNPSHLRSLPPALVQPLLMVAGVFLLTPPTAVLIAGAVAFLMFGYAACVLLLVAADRPMQREFGASAVALIRPLLDHISERNPSATESLENFFSRFSVPANLRVTLLGFSVQDRLKATVALPTVHPGPFAALGASDLPKKLEDRLGPSAGVVFTPHTPCNHDLDLPSQREVEKIGDSAVVLLAELPARTPSRASPLVSPRGGSFARAQLLGDVLMVVVTQAPAPTDDIDFALGDQAYQSVRKLGVEVALIDAHNSYAEDLGDLTYGTPAGHQMLEDCEAAARLALQVASPGAVEIGVAFRNSYSIREHGIGPAGIRALVIRAANRLTAYVLLDGNNLLQGMRAPILTSLSGVVDDAEVLTTDNHVVHEVDGGLNPVGERLSLAALCTEARELVEAAKNDLQPVQIRAGTREVPSVRVLKPAWTVRLLTSLGDTFYTFATAFVATYLLLATSSALILAAILY